MIKSKKNILVAGCSYSVDNIQSGIWKEKNLHKHYSNILSNMENIIVDNIAIGGCSNKEIFYRTSEKCFDRKYDFCIVQWSQLHRFWVYESDNNIDDGTQILPRVCGKMTDKSPAQKLHKIMTSYYLNSFVALKHWLIDQIMLQNFFQRNKIDYVFLRGFRNHIVGLEKIIKQNPFTKNKNIKPISTLSIPDDIKKILHFDQNPDHYLEQKLKDLLSLYCQIDKTFCIGYNENIQTYGIDKKVCDLDNDFADDNQHPGEKTNYLIAEKILKRIENI